MTAATFAPHSPADLSHAHLDRGSVLSYVLPLGSLDHAPAAVPRPRRRGQSAAVEAAANPAIGLVKRTNPPGMIGHRTLFAMLWVMFAAQLLWLLLT